MARSSGQGKTTVTQWRATAAAITFYFAKSRLDRGLASLTSYSALDYFDHSD